MIPTELVLVVAWSGYMVLVAMLAGSFTNLAADRLPRGESVVRPRSHCRSCGRVLDVVDLIPVGGYVVRGGCCATCDAPIGVSSPLVEALCGVAMLTSLLVLGPWVGAVGGLGAVVVIGVATVGLGFGRLQRATRGSRQG